MNDIWRFALLGLGAGAIYTLAGQGLVLVYRGSGILNFAQGAIGVAGAYVFYYLNVQHGTQVAVAVAAGILTSALLGALTYLLVIRPLRHATPLARVIATLGVLLTIQAGLLLLDQTLSSVQYVPSFLPTWLVDFGNNLVVSVDRLWLLGLAVVITIVLWCVYNFTRFGLSTSAVAENERAASLVGVSPNVVALVNWTVGGALAGIAGVCIVPIIGIHLGAINTLLLAALAAALPGSFSSFPITLATGMTIGIAQAEMARYVSTPGVGQSVPFLVIIIVLVIRGRSLPLRGTFLERMPSLGTGRVRWPALAAASVVVLVVLYNLSPLWSRAATVTLTIAIILLSIVVVTGFAGQISLGQYALAGIGAFIAARLVATQGVPFELALLIGVAGAVPIGALFALPAVRTRGANLAIVTLGLAAAIEAIVFNNSKYTGGPDGTVLGSQTFLGIDIDPITHPERYSILCFVLLLVAVLLVANLRRSAAGLRLIAVRTNERAAAALGITVWSAKLYAFAVASGVAALGGVLIAFTSHVVLFANFTSLASMTFVANAVIGGVGFLLGPVFGSTLAQGGITSKIGEDLVSDSFAPYLLLLSGAGLVFVLLRDPDGIASGLHRRRDERRTKKELKKSETAAKAVVAPIVVSAEPVMVPPKVLELRDLTVRFGGVAALAGPTLRVDPGKVLGLIGPNGAGKTTLIDAVTGFETLAGGDVLLDGQPITRRSAAWRARNGISRSFQSLELFEDLTVEENLRAAADSRSSIVYLSGLLPRRRQPLPTTAVAAATEFQLLGDLGTKVSDLSFGTRRLVGVARAVASQPSVLLLDEPAAGLSEHETRELATLVRRLADTWGIAILVIEHDMEFVMTLCDRIAVLNFGELIMEGTPDEVRNDPRVREAYLGETDETAPATGPATDSATEATIGQP